MSDSLPNQAIFDAIQLMGYEGDLTVLTFNKALFSPQWSLSSDQIPIDLPPSTYIPDSIPVSSNAESRRFQIIAKEIQHLKAQIKEAQEGRKSCQGEPSVHKDPLFDEILEDTLDYMETEDAQDVGRTRDVVNEEKDNADVEVSTEDVLKAEKKFKQLASDEEMARKLQEDWETEEERKRLAEEEATNDALIRNYDDIKARIEADNASLNEKLQEEERVHINSRRKRAKFLHGHNCCYKDDFCSTKNQKLLGINHLQRIN
ncbi:hypothetical protein Tco_0992663 [Tanacetum coccineum]|uniref:Uncharacterized protein n=1 Tax=Tanacetum coccineum TaxID=301880 RepID=A0ABQ5F3J4_9ASTR